MIINNVNTIYCIITYPLHKPATIKFTCKVPVTYGMLLYAYTIAYQWVYELEEEEEEDDGKSRINSRINE